MEGTGSRSTLLRSRSSLGSKKKKKKKKELMSQAGSCSPTLGSAPARPPVAPKEIAFQQDLPKTRSGVIGRRLLKACNQAPPSRATHLP